MTFRIGNKINTGRVATEEQRLKMSLSHKGHIPWNKGKTGIYSEETRMKMGIDKLGSTNSLASNQKRSKSLKGHPFWGNKVLSESTKEKIAKSMTGKKFPFRKRGPCSESTKEKIRMTRIGKKASLETIKKLSISHIGKPSARKGVKTFKHAHNWIEDRTKLKMDRNAAYDVRYKDWMFSVKRRDEWKCRIADSNCRGKLEAHHIMPWSKFPELRYNVNNGISLCQFHHPRKIDDVTKLSPYFQSLVAPID